MAELGKVQAGERAEMACYPDGWTRFTVYTADGHIRGTDWFPPETEDAMKKATGKGGKKRC